jgi:hypothetical protein
MSHRLCTLALALSILTLSLVAPKTLSASLFVAASDQRLAQRAPVIAEVTVAAGELSPATPVAGRPATDYLVEVERLLKGAVPGSTLVVRVPGGAPPAGTGAAGLKVWGAPSFRAGERAVLLLAANADGSYRIVDLALGAFHEVAWEGRRLAVRDLSELTRLLPGSPLAQAPAADVPRDLERFVAWLTRLSLLSESAQGGAEVPAAETADYAVRGLPPIHGQDAQDAQAVPLSPGGPAGPGGPLAASSLGGDLVWTSRNDGQRGWPDLASLAAPLAALVAAHDALEVSAGQPQEHAAQFPNLRYGGPSRSAADLGGFDGESTVLLAAATADAALAPAFDCGAGGLAAVAGTWYDGEGQVLGGGVIFAAGAACLLGGSPAASAAAMLGHELPLALLGAAAPGAAAVPAAAAAGAPAAGRGGSIALAAAAAAATGGNGSGLAAPAAASSASPSAAFSASATAAGLGDRRRRKGGAGSGSALPSRGYQERACGFDLNRNGVFGEAADCNICNGSTDGLDAGGVRQHQVYVSCNSGTDSATCGSPGSPCRTINFAWNNRTAAPGSNAADIICFRGTCHEESIMPGVSGRPGTYLKPQSGSEARPFELPTHPTMLVGWDANHNGAYPPFDSADEAVLDGKGLAEAIRLSANSPNSYVELAHFTVRDYGTSSNANDTGFLTLGGAAGSSHHVYVHDVLVQRVNGGRGLDSGHIIFNFFTGNTRLQHVAFENIQLQDVGGYVARGNGPFGNTADTAFENGPYRFERFTVSARACNASGAGACPSPGEEAHVVGWKLWGYVTGIEVLDSVLRLNPTAWNPWPTGFGSTAFVPAQCSRDWTIRNNEIDDFKIGLTVQGYATGYCDGAGARPVDGVVFDHNVFRNTYAPWLYGNNGVVISGGGPNPRTSVGKVVVSNNQFSSTPGWQGMAYIDAGNGGGPDPGNFQFVNNTTFATLTRDGFGAISVVKNNPNLPQAFYIHHNIIAGTGAGKENLHTEYAPGAWDADANVFDPGAGYTWNHSVGCGGLPAWQQASGRDRASRACVPRFANAAAGDLRIVSGDACGTGAGTNGVAPSPSAAAVKHEP